MRPRLFQVESPILPEVKQKTLYLNCGDEACFYGHIHDQVPGTEPRCALNHKCCEEPLPVSMEFAISGGGNVGDLLSDQDSFVCTRELFEKACREGLVGFHAVPVTISAVTGVPIEEFLEDHPSCFPEYCCLFSDAPPLTINPNLLDLPTNECQFCHEGVFFCDSCFGWGPACPNCEEVCIVIDKADIAHPEKQFYMDLQINRHRPQLLDLSKWRGEDLLLHDFPTVVTERFARFLEDEDVFPCRIEEFEYEISA